MIHPEPDGPSARGRGLSLVGYRGTGKTTVGRLVAEALGLPFHDADVALEARAGRAIRSIFAEDGEPAFRDLEERTLAALVDGPPAVLATGGGAILRESNRRALRRFGRVVWLRARPEVLAGRLGRDAAALAGRPSLTGAGTLEEIAPVLAARAPLYEEASDLAIDTDALEPEAVARLVLRAIDAASA